MLRTTRMDEQDLEPDAPSAGPSKVQVEGQNEAASDSGDEDAPDYSQLSSLAAKALQQGAASQSMEENIAPFIPKRGEKDFEPTGFEAQARALEKSRKAMFDVIRCERVVASKNISIAMWEPGLNRAIVELARGSVFSSMGVARRVNVLTNGNDEDIEHHCFPGRTDLERDGVWKEGSFYEKTRSRLELLPEEALYLVERGSLECRIRGKGKAKSSLTEKTDYDVDSEGADWAPMSVQQAFATLLFKEDLTRERYQLYAYLRRLGYVVQRKSITESLRSAAALRRGLTTADAPIEMKGVIANPQHPLKLVSLFDLLLYPLRRIQQVSLYGLQHFSSWFYKALQWLRSTVSRTNLNTVSSDIAGRGMLGIGGKKWNRYEEVFNRLRIIPSGHDQKVHPRHPKKPQSNDKVPEIFFYAWRPATRFKKTDPPLPEYRIATVDARVTTLPSLYAFESLMDGVPIPLTSEDLEEMDEGEQKEWKRAQEEKKRNDESYGRGAVKKLKAEKAASDKLRSQAKLTDQSIMQKSRSYLMVLYRRITSYARFITHCFTLLPPGCASVTPARRPFNPAKGRPVNVFPPLKMGRRSVIVAVNDCGTTSLLRFGESQFDRWRLAGSAKEV
jgi:tRNA-splicing endonuclease subunit Sen54